MKPLWDSFPYRTKREIIEMPMNDMTHSPARRRVLRTAPRCLLVALVVLSCAACVPPDAGADAGRFRGEPMLMPVERPDFTLADTNGHPYSFLEETQGRIALLFFGYTHCPDICPIHMANIGQVLKGVPTEDRHRVEVVFVSTDPARDTPARIRMWLDIFDSSFVGLRGSIEEVNRIQNQVSLPASVPGEPDDDGNYLVGHAASVLAFSADGPARLRYPFGTRQTVWAHDLPLLIEESRSGS